MIDFYFSLQDLEAGKPPTPTLNPRRFHMPSSEATGGLLLAAASRAARALEALPELLANLHRSSIVCNFVGIWRCRDEGSQASHPVIVKNRDLLPLCQRL